MATETKVSAPSKGNATKFSVMSSLMEIKALFLTGRLPRMFVLITLFLMIRLLMHIPGK